jgi:hypothetical protein
VPHQLHLLVDLHLLLLPATCLPLFHFSLKNFSNFHFFMKFAFTDPKILKRHTPGWLQTVLSTVLDCTLGSGITVDAAVSVVFNFTVDAAVSVVFKN